jgi:uncharacterized protein (TIGR03790 family)
VNQASLKSTVLTRILILLAIVRLSTGAIAAVEPGQEVIVIYNSVMPRSKEVAEHYAAARHVPPEQILGLELSTSETITRTEFRSDLQKPLLKWLEQKKLLTFRLDSSATNPSPHWQVKEAKIRYAVLCYGVPLRILEDATLHESVEQVPVGARRNGAAVDSELTLLPMQDFKLPLTGPLRNFSLGNTNSATLNPVGGILLVARLDGPTAEIARGLVDLAIRAESDGLWGRAYFDLRGITNDYKIGDDMIRSAAFAAKQFGFETVLDEKPETFPSSFPMSQIALYAGWYDENVSGPFSIPKVEFMPGAIAYHLHSFSAATLRSPSAHWAGPLLAKGVTGTMGCVDEPFLAGTPEVAVFFNRLFRGYTFGEAAWAAAPVLSWQTTVVGDPLYRPFGKPPREQHEHLAADKNNLIEWSHLRVANLNLTQGFPVSEVIAFLQAEGTNSAVLTEKLADVYSHEGKREEAHEAYKRALTLKPTPQQEIRLKQLVSKSAPQK